MGKVLLINSMLKYYKHMQSVKKIGFKKTTITMTRQTDKMVQM